MIDWGFLIITQIGHVIARHTAEAIAPFLFETGMILALLPALFVAPNFVIPLSIARLLRRLWSRYLDRRYVVFFSLFIFLKCNLVFKLQVSSVCVWTYSMIIFRL